MAQAPLVQQPQLGLWCFSVLSCGRAGLSRDLWLCFAPATLGLVTVESVHTLSKVNVRFPGRNTAQLQLQTQEGLAVCSRLNTEVGAVRLSIRKPCTAGGCRTLGSSLVVPQGTEGGAGEQASAFLLPAPSSQQSRFSETTQLLQSLAAVSGHLWGMLPAAVSWGALLCRDLLRICCTHLEHRWLDGSLNFHSVQCESR